MQSVHFTEQACLSPDTVRFGGNWKVFKLKQSALTSQVTKAINCLLFT